MPRWTRGRALRAAVAGGALIGGGAFASRQLAADADAAPSGRRDAEILAFFLRLEQVQEGLYRGAERAGLLDEPLREYVRVVAPQEREHVAFLAARAGSDGGPPPKSDFGDALESLESFRAAAIELEELALAAYIGQGANLTRDAVADVARIVSVEARQAAWLRDLAGEDPAPRAADPPREPDDVLAALRRRNYIQ
jgi:hypothetical protein